MSLPALVKEIYGILTHPEPPTEYKQECVTCPLDSPEIIELLCQCSIDGWELVTCGVKGNKKVLIFKRKQSKLH